MYRVNLIQVNGAKFQLGNSQLTWVFNDTPLSVNYAGLLLNIKYRVCGSTVVILNIWRVSMSLSICLATVPGEGGER